MVKMEKTKETAQMETWEKWSMYTDKNKFQKSPKKLILFTQSLACSTLWKKNLNIFFEWWKGVDNILNQLLYLKVKLVHQTLEKFLCNYANKQESEGLKATDLNLNIRETWINNHRCLNYDLWKINSTLYWKIIKWHAPA